MCHQRSRLSWIQSSDKNTAFSILKHPHGSKKIILRELWTRMIDEYRIQKEKEMVVLQILF